MKKLLIATMVLGLISCSNEGGLISYMKSEFKKYELPNFNDPKSFEEVDAKIVDTTYEKHEDSLFIESFYDGEKYKTEMDLYKSFYERESKENYLHDLAEENKKNYLENKEKYENSLREKDSALKVNSKIPTDKIRYVNLKYKIRAKNAMGGLILKEINVKYSLKADTLGEKKEIRYFRFNYGDDKFKN
jgi:hypothetical protein